MVENIVFYSILFYSHVARYYILTQGLGVQVSMIKHLISMCTWLVQSDIRVHAA
jgi:hypothetical protein